MSLSELAALIQSGHEELLPELWKQCRRFIVQQANRYFKAYFDNGYCEIDDLIQSGYEAIIAALKTYNANTAGFLTWLNYYLANAFRYTAGCRTDKDKLQRMLELSSVSIDKPIDDDGNKLLDIIPDNSDYYEPIEADIYTAGLRRHLDAVIDELPATDADYIRQEYFEGRNRTDIAAEHAVAPSEVQKALPKLRKVVMYSPIGNELKEYISEDGNYQYRNTGLQSFMRTGSSETERAAFRLVFNDL